MGARIVAERVEYLDENGKLVTESLRDFTRTALKKRIASLDDFLKRWKSADRKQAIIEELEAEGLALEHLQFRYEVTGDKPSWRPLRAFDDGQKVYIQFPPGIAQGDMPPLFVIGPVGEAQLVNYRVRAPYYIVDRLFKRAQLRVGAKTAVDIRCTRRVASR